ncbi:uncharacterized protein LOC127251588 [Andrographis paniculata]|uniref:uncharacterized protein LOC127251588 n=1 Tax=Andrographis paniculata TaxID=175694 RepID=UPI0021E84C9E|nr:uncharacterized protein LOC127251588 [Andrographis paniculata]
MMSNDETNRMTASSNKKRKFQAELLRMNLQKKKENQLPHHKCSSSDLIMNRHGESEPRRRSICRSLAFASRRDHDDTKSCILHSKTTTVEPGSTTSAGCSRFFLKMDKDYPLAAESSFSRSELLLDYGCSECRKDNLDRCSNKELEDLLYSNEAATTNFVLSSGRWSVTPGNLGDDHARPGTAKMTTIDKEFEQYFGMLM